VKKKKQEDSEYIDDFFAEQQSKVKKGKRSPYSGYEEHLILEYDAWLVEKGHILRRQEGK
jgi:hypothetical protein